MKMWMPASAREAGRVALVALAVLASAWLAIALTRVPSGVASIWVANGILLAVLLRRPTPHWPLLFALGWAANFLPRVWQGEPALLAAGMAAINIFEVACMAFVIRARVPDVNAPRELLPLSRVATISALQACLLSATAAALLRMAYGNPFGEVWVAWFSAHLLGVVITATLVLVALREGPRLLGKPGRRGDFAVCVLLLLATCVLVFGQARYPLLYLVHLPLLLLTYRHGLAGVVVGMFFISTATFGAAILQIGPFAMLQQGTTLERTLLAQVFVGATVLLALPVGLVLTAGRRLAAQVRESEARYRLLADHAQDIVVRVGTDGFASYISPSVRELLGWTPQEFGDQVVHPEDLERRNAVFARLLAKGGDAKVVYRVRHRDGHEVWLEALARQVAAEGDDGGGLVYSARDVSARVFAKTELARNRQRLQSLIDGIPAMVAHVDPDQRYTFVNQAAGAMLGVDRNAIAGRTMRDVRGEVAYQAIEPYVEAALRGEPQTFEGTEELHGGRRIEFQASYVPDLDDDGEVRGFHSLTTDISALKQAERELAQLARKDPLTGLANRREFDERLDQAVIRTRRLELPIALMLLDVDYFKQINDIYGHPAGDAVLKEFAGRIQASIYDVDLAARLGGDEFAVLFEYARGIQQVAIVARKILEAMQAPVVLENGTAVQIGTSIGIGFQREVSYGLSLMALADKALYAAKQAGRGTYRQLHD